MPRRILIFLLGALMPLASVPSLATDPTPGQIIIQKRKASGSGFENLSVTPQNNKVLGFDNSGNLVMSNGGGGGGGSSAWADITGKPTTLSGYGITDAITAVAVAAGYQPLNAKLSDVAGLSLQQGDILWYDSGHLVRLGHGSGGVLMSMTDIGGSWSVGWGSSAVTINGQMAFLGGSADITLPYTSIEAGDAVSGQVLQFDGTDWVPADPSAGSGHTIQEEGSSLTARANLNFVGGGVTASDDSGNNATKVTVTRTGVYRTISVKASEMIPRVTSGASIQSYEKSTSKTNYDVLEFDASTQQYAQVWVWMPDEYDGGTVKVKLSWETGSGSGDVVWKVSAGCVGNTGGIAVTQGTAQSVTSTSSGTEHLNVTSATAAITASGSPAGGQWEVFEISRDAANGSDTLGVNARLIGIAIQYKESATETSSW